MLGIELLSSSTVSFLSSTGFCSSRLLYAPPLVDILLSLFQCPYGLQPDIALKSWADASANQPLSWKGPNLLSSRPRHPPQLSRRPASPLRHLQKHRPSTYCPLLPLWHPLLLYCHHGSATMRWTLEEGPRLVQQQPVPARILLRMLSGAICQRCEIYWIMAFRSVLIIVLIMICSARRGLLVHRQQPEAMVPDQHCCCQGGLLPGGVVLISHSYRHCGCS